MCKLKFTQMLKVTVHKPLESCLSHAFSPSDIKQCVTI